MESFQRQIAAKLETVFWERGFVTPSVPDLRDRVGVSLRTFHRLYPEREDMVIAALDHRHWRYLESMRTDMPPVGRDAATHILERLGNWMQHTDGRGCMFYRALSAHPNSVAIRETVQTHKRELVSFMEQAAGSLELGSGLYLLHEGATAAWTGVGPQAIVDAKRLAVHLFEDH